MMRHEPRTHSQAIGNVVVSGAFAVAFTAFVLWFDSAILREWLWPGSTPPAHGAREYLSQPQTLVGVLQTAAPLFVFNFLTLCAWYLVYQSVDSLKRFRRDRPERRQVD
jgi:hypothetical protein